ncbi:DUF7305 domain-containing protein [Alteromonas gilva]|uniref:PilX N-terminal domain-containing pilus assembly protein n=1 Tax=Alteromonas gilva TaxID=2987522 RepID=A0ABT5L0C0_9ALTE|nr:PilX N-terminal domain-containing pilus assembly protein [Alteromonas gilva]MDC8829884.1 PilX N-terminal domain-containing pilus assembly protein [Alteromonas gilva]
MMSRSRMGFAARTQGFTLVFVLLLLLMASVIVFKTIQANIQQERTSGNMRKQLNAQLAAEQGIYSVFSALKNLLATSSTPINSAEELLNQLNNQNLALQGTGSVDGSVFEVAVARDTNTIELISTGNSFESEKVIGGLINFAPAGPVSPSPFISAVTGCNGVSLQGSGLVDSFDSTRGNYTSSIASGNATVSTIIPGADIELQGNSPVQGNVLGTGNVTLLGSSPVMGDIRANGDIAILGGNGAYGYRVSGSVRARGNYTQASVGVYGDVETDGDATLTWNSVIETGVLRYAGSLIVPANWNGDTSGFIHTDPDIPLVPNSGSADSETYAQCDPLGIEATMADLRSATVLPDLTIGPWMQRNYSLTPSEGVFTDNSNSAILTPETLMVEGNTVSAYRVNSLSVSQNGTLDISGGDVIVYISQDFTMHGGVDLTIAVGSSLTLYIEGRFSFTGGAISIQQHGMTSTGLPALSIFSNYVSANDEDIGIEISGSSDIYSAVYAPFANVDIRGAGELYGAVIGNIVQVTGAGGIHFDEALGSSTIPTQTQGGQGTINLDGLYTY